MRSIYKYQFGITDRQQLGMPVGAKILNVGLQYDMPCLWAEIDLNVGYQYRDLLVIGTGNPMPDTEGFDYIGSFETSYGFVGHVYLEHK